jgi:hypothetical protein
MRTKIKLGGGRAGRKPRKGKHMRRSGRWQLISPAGRLFPATLIDTTKCTRMAIFRVSRKPMTQYLPEGDEVDFEKIYPAAAISRNKTR